MPTPAHPEHTRTPWRIAGFDDPIEPTRAYIRSDDENTELVATVFSRADAEYIVTACNAHYALVEALRKLMEDHSRVVLLFKPDDERCGYIREECRAAEALLASLGESK
jgi:hypothetical protein